MGVGWGLYVLGTKQVAVEFAVRGFWGLKVRELGLAPKAVPACY
jgi:hypothetical protein